MTLCMVSILGTIQLLLILIVCKKEYDYRSPAIFLWATLLVMFGIPHLGTTFFNDTGYSSGVLNEVSMFVILFCAVYVLSRTLLSVTYASDRLKIDVPQSPKKSLIIMRVLFWGLFVVVSYMVYDLVRHTGGFLFSSWASMRETMSNKDYLSAAMLTWSVYYVFSSAFLYALITKNRKYAFLSAALILICTIVSRNRVEVLPLPVGLILYFLYMKGTMSLKKIVYFVFFSFFSLYLITALIVFRHYGTVAEFADAYNFIDFNSRILEKTSTRAGSGELSLREVFYYFVSKDNQFKNFNQGHTYVRMLLVLFPTGIFSDIKPPDFAISMGTAYRPGEEGFSTHPTLFGDCYANFGFSGILLGLFWAFYVVIMDKITIRNNFFKLTLLVSVSCSYVVIGRGSVYNSFFTLFYSVVIAYFAYYFLFLHKRKTESSIHEK